MADAVHVPLRATRGGLVVRFLLLLALVFVGERLTADVVLPGLWGFPALAGYVAFVLLAPVLVGNVLCDRLDRLRGRTDRH